MSKTSPRHINIRFRRWSRKSYAVFCSLGKVVTIGYLRKSAIQASMMKQHLTDEIFVSRSNELCYNKEKEKDKIEIDIVLSLFLSKITKPLQTQFVLANRCVYNSIINIFMEMPKEFFLFFRHLFL